MNLTSAEIHLILDLLTHETVVPESIEFPYRIVKVGRRGYSEDKQVGALQAKLSIMLEVAGRLGR